MAHQAGILLSDGHHHMGAVAALAGIDESLDGLIG